MRRREFITLLGSTAGCLSTAGAQQSLIAQERRGAKNQEVGLSAIQSPPGGKGNVADVAEPTRLPGLNSPACGILGSGSVGLDTSFFDDWTPLCRFGLKKGSKLARRGGHYRHGNFLKSFLDGWMC